MKKTIHYDVDYKYGEDSSVDVMAYVWGNGKQDEVALTMSGGNFRLNELFNPARARQLADALMKAADQVDAWAEQKNAEVSQ